MEYGFDSSKLVAFESIPALFFCEKYHTEAISVYLEDMRALNIFLAYYPKPPFPLKKILLRSTSCGMELPASLIMLFVGFTRVFTAAHYLTNILAGFALGIALVRSGVRVD